MIVDVCWLKHSIWFRLFHMLVNTVWLASIRRVTILYIRKIILYRWTYTNNYWESLCDTIPKWQRVMCKNRTCQSESWQLFIDFHMFVTSKKEHCIFVNIWIPCVAIYFQMFQMCKSFTFVIHDTDALNSLHWLQLHKSIRQCVLVLFLIKCHERTAVVSQMLR